MLHGRIGEVERLRGLLNGAAEGKSSALVIRGEAGAGKSVLLDFVCESAPTGSLVLRARGVEFESDLPYAGLHQLLRPVLDHVDGLPLPQKSALRGALGLDSSGTSDTHNISLAVLTLLGEVGAGQPVVAVVDDIQWLDHESTRTITFAARRLHAEGVLMLFATRPDVFEPSSLPELALGPLDTPTASAILADVSGTTAAQDVVQRITSASGGNALAIAELATMLSPEQISGRVPLPLNLPVSAGAERLFAPRIEGLSVPSRNALLAAAAEDTGSTTVVFGAAARLGGAADDLEDAERVGLVKVDGSTIRFRHPLVRSTVYGTATFAERRRVHEALAEEYLAIGDQDRQAWHRAGAALAPDESAAASLDDAARRAHVRGAYATAATAYEKAAELSATPDLQGRRLVEAAREAWLSGLLPRAARLIETAEPLLEDTSQLADCYRLRGSIELATGAAPNTVEILMKAARHTADVDPGRAVELLALAGEGASLQLDAIAAAEISRIASGLAEAESDRDKFFARLLVGFTHLTDHPEVAMTALHEAIDYARDETEDVDLLLAAGRAAFYVGNDQAALDFHGRIMQRARRIASIGCLAIAGSRMALAEMQVGQWGTGMATAEETSRMAEDTGQVELAAHALVWQALVAAWRGEEARCRQLTEQARRITAHHSMPFVEDGIRWANGALELSLGHGPQASTQFRGIRHPVIMNAAALDGVEAAVVAGDDAEIDRWVRWTEDTAVLTEAPWARARLAHANALVTTEPKAADAWFTDALDEHRRGGRIFETARTELAFGSFLRRQRRRVDARQHLRAALGAFDDLGAAPWAERAQTELRATGESARRRDPSTARDLTPQEIQVAAFVAQGMTNREVAAQLFLSPRTVDYHLRSIFTKLGIISRTELAAMSHELAFTGSD